jgi:hypothetical protein
MIIVISRSAIQIHLQRHSTIADTFPDRSHPDTRIQTDNTPSATRHI